MCVNPCSLSPDSDGVAVLTAGEVRHSTAPEIVCVCPSTMTVAAAGADGALGGEPGPLCAEQAGRVAPSADTPSAVAPTAIRTVWRGSVKPGSLTGRRGEI